ncbi:hypothetical protein, partial [Undibacterium sp.]|uniref:hypothetical protein n=1 Tax=Undibacterium sp. TaxID=1914977 RepID=UPI0037505AB7
MLDKEIIISPVFKYPLILIVIVGYVFGLTLPVFALGLGEMRVRSALGQSLLVHADIVGGETEVINPSCLRARVVTMDGIFIS